MKKLVMTGTILTLALTVGTAAFAANAAPTESVKTETPVALTQNLNNSLTLENSTATDSYRGNQYHMNFMDEDGDGVCDYWNAGMHDENGHHRDYRGDGMHNGRHHGSYNTQNSTSTTTSSYQNIGWSGGHC